MAIKKLINDTDHGLQLTLWLRVGSDLPESNLHIDTSKPGDAERVQINLDPKQSDTVVYGSDANPFLDALDVVMVGTNGKLQQKVFAVHRGDKIDDMLNTNHTFKFAYIEGNLTVSATNSDTESVIPSKYIMNATSEAMKVELKVRQGESSRVRDSIAFELEPRQTRRVNYGDFKDNYLLSIAYSSPDGKHEKFDLSVADQSDQGPFAQNTLVLGYGKDAMSNVQTFRTFTVPSDDTDA